MAYIYVITNKINSKQYVGKTNYSITKRFKEHCRDSKKERYEKRPLYNAMNKYGVENFFIEELEECHPNDSASREEFWIKKLDTYNNGYNATLGGDSKKYIDYEKILNIFNSTDWCVNKIAKETNHDKKTIKNILLNMGISEEEIKKRGNNARQKNITSMQKAVIMLDKDTEEEIMNFESLSKAAEYLQKSGQARTHISEVCKNKRKTAYGYKWKFI